jgi:predicted nucleic acid-binding protein
MSIDRSTVLFFDASCLVAASGSATGGSTFPLAVCARGFLTAAVSQPVLIEAERNVIENLQPNALLMYYRLVAATPLVILPLPPRSQRRRYEEIVGNKDEHVLRAATEGGADYLLTLDQQLGQRVNQAHLTLQAIAPGDFIKRILPDHPDLPSIR